MEPADKNELTFRAPRSRRPARSSESYPRNHRSHHLFRNAREDREL